VAIRLAAGANALETANRVKAKMAELSKYFPPGMRVVYPYDSTPFVKISIEEVVHTLVEAIFLVFIVMFLFLQNFRATLIPTIAVPVVLLGTMGVLAASGFSINTLTMFALVIVIGLLVDDAIVVVENVERIMSEEGLSPHDATIKSMSQITSALWGIATVLSAVFLPMAFFGGSTGVIYRQFSITIISAMILSVLVAQILTPALCATILKPVEKGRHAGKTGLFAWFFRYFNRVFDFCRGKYEGVVGRSFGKPVRYLIIYGAIVMAMGYFFLHLPTSFLPDEDQGYFIINVELPEGVYAGLLGPSYETPAEIRFLRVIGADLVGMSTVPEVIVARQIGIKVLAISCVTNMAAGILDQALNHEEVLETGRRVAGHFKALLREIIPEIARDLASA
jgi:multidrug efflux pump